MRRFVSKQISLFAIALLCPAMQDAKAEQTYIRASIDSAVMMIGQQSRIHLDITADQGKVLQLPIFTDTIVGGVEVLSVDPIDTVLIDNNRMQLRQSVLITSFDSALYYIPPFRVIDGPDTAYSNSLALKMATYPIENPADIEIFDIKAPWKPQFVFSDYIWWILIPLFLAILGLIIGLLILYLRKRSKEEVRITPEMLISPYERALQELEKIKKEKLWQQGRIKEYYTLLTDVLRIYLNGRYDIDAMEMTTSEILERVRSLKEAKPFFDRFKELLMTADFVKFAKYIPLSDENEALLNTAYLFIEATRDVVEDKVNGSEDNTHETSGIKSDEPIKNDE